MLIVHFIPRLPPSPACSAFPSTGEWTRGRIALIGTRRGLPLSSGGGWTDGADVEETNEWSTSAGRIVLRTPTVPRREDKASSDKAKVHTMGEGGREGGK